MKKTNPKIALAPIKYFDLSDKNNFEKVKSFIRLAAKKKADIICFPESCLHKSKALPFNHIIIKEIREECRKNKIWAIVTDDLIINKGKPYNMAILIDRGGKIKGKYKKIHTYGENVRPGKKVQVFETDFGKIGIVICWDLAFPDLFKKIKSAGADIVFCPAQWCYEEKIYESHHKEKELEILKSLVTARAYENLFYVALCNPLIDRKDLVSYSAIVSPTKILKETFDEETLMVHELDLKDIGRYQKIYGNAAKKYQ